MQNCKKLPPLSSEEALDAKPNGHIDVVQVMLDIPIKYEVVIASFMTLSY